MLRTCLEYLICNPWDSSAGSGKTFTLAREYLKLLLRPGAQQAYRHILAITFTNKAVGELKERILKSLMEFSKEGGRSEILPMFLSVKDALGIDAAELRERSKKVLQDLLHNYAFFDVSTIDRFNHRVLRTFAQDLELQSNFEVVLDTDSLLMQAVDILVSRAGTHPKLTETLIEFALEKAEQDRSWDVSRDLFEMGKLLFDENHYAYLEALSDKEMDDFLSLIDTNQLEFEDFKGRYFPKFIEKIAGGDFNQDFDSKWKREFGKEPLYP
ncbi:MAG: UvrD-helicase domain-containing protein, partial [Robiginitalea sp.]